MDAADPLLAASSPTRLLRWTIGPAPAASPSKAQEALLHAIARPLKGSKELVEQARMAMKEHGDIRMLYQDDGAKASSPANSKKDQQGRRPTLNRKRGHFSMKAPARKSLPVVDRSKLLTIKDPVEYFKTVDQIEEAEEEIKRLNGEVVGPIYNFEPVEEPKRRPGLLWRKSVFTFKYSNDAYALDPVEVPASQTGTTTESQLSQDAAHTLVSEKNEQSIPSRSGERAISDDSEREVHTDSFSEKDDGDELSYLLTSLQDVDESKEEEFIQKTIGYEEPRMENVPLRDSIPGYRSLISNAVRKRPMRVRTPERPLPWSLEARVLELEEHFFLGDASKDKCMDLLSGDESEGSPDIVMGEQSPVHDSSDVLMTENTFTAREIDRETPNLSAKSVEHVLDPEPNMPDHVDERLIGGSPLGFYNDTEVCNEKAASSGHNNSMEEENVPINYPIIDMPNNETEVSSSHQLEGSSTEVLVSTSCRTVASNGIARTSHAAEDHFQHLEEVEEDGVVKDKSSHPLEMPLEDISQHNESQIHGGNIKKLAADGTNALSPTNKNKLQSVRKGKEQRQSKRRQKVADESTHPPEIPEANFDSENQHHADDVNNENQTVGTSNDALSPNKAKGQKGPQRRNKSEKLNRRSLTDAGLAWQSGVRRSTRIRSRPLQHWLGERFVYGRIHDTMATVIGIKALSPDQDGKKALKVKSFIPEKYSDLVAEAAKY